MPVRTVDYSVQTFLPPCVDDLVGPNHPIRDLSMIVDQFDLEGLGFDTSYEPDGRAKIAADMLLKLWLWGYCNRVRSSRKLEHFCRENLPALWLCGMRVPDHTTLSRFWKKHYVAIGNLLKESVLVAHKAGLVNLALVAVDGTTISARSSRRSLWNKDQLEKQLQALDEYRKDLEQQIRQSELSEKDAFELRESVTNALEREERVRQAMTELEAQRRQSLHPHEPDVAVMNCEGRRQPAWNCQAAVDEKCGIVLAASVTNDAHDCHCLTQMMEETVANLDGTRPQLFVQDSAYGRSAAEVHEAKQSGHTFVTAGRKGDHALYHRNQFDFDRSKMQLICPLGFLLKHTGNSTNADGQVERFRCLDWKRCGAGCACYGKSKSGRKVEISSFHEVMKEHREQCSRLERRRLMRRRLKTVEPLFAHHKEQSGFRRFTFRGHDAVETQWRMLNLVVNLKIMSKRGVVEKVLEWCLQRQNRGLGRVKTCYRAVRAWLWRFRLFAWSLCDHRSTVRVG